MSFVVLPIMIFIMLLIMTVPVVMGVFVYGDAKARGMDPLLWTLLTVFAPGFVGLIIYLVMRREHVRLNCPNCGGEVQQSFVSCPNCGQKLCASCGSCGAAISPEWKLCPQCGAEISGTSDFAPPVVAKQPESKGLLAVILVILAVPLVLAAVVAVAGFAYRFVNNVGGGQNSREVTEYTWVADIDPLTVTPSDASVLTEAHRDWIRQKQAGQNGIYATNFTKEETGTQTNDGVTCDYWVEYNYTVIVVNAKDGKTYVPGDMAFDYTTPYLAEFVTANLREADSGDEEALRYGNVFVVRTVSSYSIQIRHGSDTEPEIMKDARYESDNTMILRLTDRAGNQTASCKIPFFPEENFYSSFKK